MRIGVDATCWHNKRGYGRHSRSLLRALVGADTDNHYTFFMDSAELLGEVPERAEIRLTGATVPTAIAASADGRRSLRDMWDASRAMSSDEFDVLLFPTIYSFVPTLSRAKKLVMIHDVIAETFPKLTTPRFTSRMAWRAKVALGRMQADALVTVSEFSKRGIVSYFGVPPARVFVVGEASDPVFHRLETPAPTPSLAAMGLDGSRRTIVYVGGFGPHKNVDMLVAAFAELQRKPGFDDVRLVLAGEYKKEVFHTSSSELISQIEMLGIRDRVVFTGYISDEELVVLLNLATVLALPSMMEGFGLPAVEAAACGCPVIATKSSPLPELLGAGGVFIHPTQPELARALEAVLGSPELRDRMRTSGLAAAGALTWAAAAEQMRSVLRTVTQ